MFIVKPTAPTSRHFAIDSMGYANSSALSFTKPDINNDMDWNSVVELRNTKPNKWDDSILLKWKDAIITVADGADDVELYLNIY